MRFPHVLHAAMAGIFVVPAVTLTSGDAQGLEQALTETVNAIESLTGLRTALVQGPDEATPVELADTLEVVLAVTEQPGESGPQKDELLTTLRRDVSRLQMLLDDLITVPGSSKDSTSPQDSLSNGASLDHSDSDTETTRQGLVVPSITTGLDDAQRAALMDIQAPIVQADDYKPTQTPVRRTDEGESFSADPLRLGHAYYRAGRYAEGLVILSRIKDDPEAKYWHARCLEHLERFDEALAGYEEVVAHPEAGYLADRAKSDLAFLSWKRDFSQRVTPAASSTQGPSGR